jgi:hypothetical protein
VSVAARELCCRVAVSGVSFLKAAEMLDRVGNIRIGKDWMRLIVEGEGRSADAARQAGRLGPDWKAGDCPVEPGGPTRLIVGADGVMVPMVTQAEKQKRRANRAAKRAGKKLRRRKAKRLARRVRGADQSYKEFKIGTFYDQSREHQYAFGTSGDHQQLGRMLRREAGKLGFGQADEKVSASDGAEWIRRQLQVRLPMLDAMILDFFHLAEHVALTAKICFGEGHEQAGSWTDQMLKAAKKEGAGGLLLGIAELSRSVRGPGKKKALTRIIHTVLRFSWRELRSVAYIEGVDDLYAQNGVIPNG